MTDKKTIMIIDDDKMMTTLLKAVLEKHGYLTSCINDGTQGFEKIKAIKPDAIILDRNMPGIDGNDILKLVLTTPEVQNIPIMMLTSQSDISDVSESLSLGAKEYIVKPFDNTNFIIRLKNMLNKK